MKISNILKKYDTDKNSGKHCYGPAYDQLFKSFNRKSNLDIIEIGTQFGESLRAWREFFPNADITGVDIVDIVEEKYPGIGYIISDVKELKMNKEFDIVIDDGSHKLSDVLYTVKNFKLKKNGMMIIEDCQAPGHWFRAIKELTEYSVEGIDLRSVNKRRDDYLIVLRNYDYN